MSLFSTIAHPGATRTKTFSVAGAAKVAVGLILGLAIGMVVSMDRSAVEGHEGATAVQSALGYHEFIRLNTTDLEYPSPAVAAPEVRPQAVVDPFLYWNTTALDGIAPPAHDGDSPDGVTEHFLEWNTTSLQYPSSYTEPSSGPR